MVAVVGLRLDALSLWASWGEHSNPMHEYADYRAEHEYQADDRGLDLMDRVAGERQKDKAGNEKGDRCKM